MGSVYIVFDTDADASNAVDTCWIQFLKDQVNGGYTAVSDNGQTYTDLSELTDAQIFLLRLYGKSCNGEDVTDRGVTDCYQTFIKAYEQDKWFLPEPAPEYLALLSGYVIMTGQQIVDAGYYGPE